MLPEVILFETEVGILYRKKVVVATMPWAEATLEPDLWHLVEDPLCNDRFLLKCSVYYLVSFLDAAHAWGPLKRIPGILLG